MVGCGRITRERDYGFDSMKAVLLFLMIFGHTIDDFISTGVIETDLVKALIYSFHMPAFVFISGYFRKSASNYKKIFQNLLLPYIIFTFIFNLISRRDLLVDFFNPSYIYWYLLSMFFWCLMADSIRNNVKYPIVISILVALYAGCFEHVNRFMSISRTICFFPFFILGMKMSEKQVVRIREQRKWIAAILIFLLCVMTTVLNQRKIMPMHMYNAFCGYSEMNLAFVQGALLRLVSMIIAFFMILCLINLLGNKKTFLSQIGNRSITIFVFSGFSVRICYAVISHILNVNSLSPFLIYVYAAVVAVGTILFGSLDVVNRVYGTFISWAGNLLFKESKTE